MGVRAAMKLRTARSGRLTRRPSSSQSLIWSQADYQEVVNSKSIHFAAEGGSTSLDGAQFLNEVGSALEKYKKLHCCNSFSLRTLHPRLDNLEDTIADWLTAAFAERPAYQAMSSMDRRTSERKEDYFNALIGAITAEPLRDRSATALHPAEYFMRLCEEKGDFSFIYSSAPRSNAPGRSWRPLAGPIPAIQPCTLLATDSPAVFVRVICGSTTCAA